MTARARPATCSTAPACSATGPRTPATLESYGERRARAVDHRLRELRARVHRRRRRRDGHRLVRAGPADDAGQRAAVAARIDHRRAVRRRRLRRVRATPPARTLTRAPPASPPRWLAALLATVALAGCLSIHDPDSQQPAPPPPATTAATTGGAQRTVANADPAPERGGTHPRRPPAQPRARSRPAPPQPRPPRRSSATRRCGPTGPRRTVIARQRAARRRSRSARPARKRCRPPRASPHDSTLPPARSPTAARSSRSPRRSPTAGQWVVVTRETTTGQGDYDGLPATLHVTYAQLTHTRQRDRRLGMVAAELAPQPPLGVHPERRRGLAEELAAAYGAGWTAAARRRGDLRAGPGRAVLGAPRARPRAARPDPARRPHRPCKRRSGSW